MKKKKKKNKIKIKKFVAKRKVKEMEIRLWLQLFIFMTYSRHVKMLICNWSVEVNTSNLLWFILLSDANLCMYIITDTILNKCSAKDFEFPLA